MSHQLSSISKIKFCPVGTWIDLANEVPANILRELPRIDDRALSIGLEGFPFTTTDIETILLSRYPDLPRLFSSPNGNNPITLLFERALTPDQEARVRSFMTGCLPEWPIAIDVAVSGAAVKERPNARLGVADIEVRPSRLRPLAPPFVREDEAFWFENLDALFEGRLHLNSFLELSNAGTSCYIDSTSFHQIDLRQAVLLYDTVYLTPPLTDSPGSRTGFWEDQAVTREDALRLVEVGRIRLILVQPEERTDSDFLRAAYERYRSGVIGRLTAAAMMVSDIVATAEEYTLSRPELRPIVSQLSKRIAQETGESANTITKLLLWPLHARRSCLQPLMSRGLMGIGAFSQSSIFADQVRAAAGRDVELEAHATSDAVHIAHVLHATLIPPTREMQGWIEPRRIVGDRLNFYRSFNSRIAAAWAINERRKEERLRIVPPVPLFDFHRHASIDDLIAVTSLGSTRRKGRAIMTRLSGLPPEERTAEIERLSKEFYDLGARRSRRGFAIDTFSDAVDIGAAILDMSLAPVRPMWNFLNRSLDVARRAPALDSFVDAIEKDLQDQFGRNSDLDFLSKVSRVAELRELEDD